MKKSLVWTILGFSVAATTGAHGQGGIIIGNYQAPYNRVLWYLPGPPVRSTDGVNLTLWFGEGALDDANDLKHSVPLDWHLYAENNGYAGYYSPTVAILHNWSKGETWTFQISVSYAPPHGLEIARSDIWYENENIAFIGGDPPLPPGVSQNSIGLVILPEPSTFALGGLGLAAILVCRRRSRSMGEDLV